MKQYISKEQWDELEKKEQDILRDFIGFNNLEEHLYAFNICEMIEFFGDSLDCILKATRYTVQLCDDTGDIVFTCSKLELVDALWEACKYNLKKCNIDV